MNRAVKIGLAGTCTALLVLGGIGTYNIVHGLTSDSASAAQPKSARTFDSSAVSSTPPTDAEAVKQAHAFLDSWSKQHLDGAAGGTDLPGTASQALRHTRTACT